MNPNLFCIRASNQSNFTLVNNVNDIESLNTERELNKDFEYKNFIIVKENNLYKIFNFNEYMSSLVKNTVVAEIYSDNSPINFDAKTNLIVKLNKNNQNLEISDDGRFWSIQTKKTKIKNSDYNFISPLFNCAYCYKNGILYTHNYENITSKIKINIPEENLIGMVATEYGHSILHRFINPVVGMGFYIPGTFENPQITTDYTYAGCVNQYSDLPSAGEWNKTVYKVKKQNKFFMFNGAGTWSKTFPIFKVPYDKKSINIKSLDKKIIIFFYTDKTIILDLSINSSVVLPKTFLIDYLPARKNYVNYEILDSNNTSIMNFVGEPELIDNFNKNLSLLGVWSAGYKGLIPLYFDEEDTKIKSCVSGEFRHYEYVLTDEHSMLSFFSEAGCLIPANSFNLTHDEHQIWSLVEKKDRDLNLSNILENEIYDYPGQNKYVRYIST